MRSVGHSFRHATIGHMINKRKKAAGEKKDGANYIVTALSFVSIYLLAIIFFMVAIRLHHW